MGQLTAICLKLIKKVFHLFHLDIKITANRSILIGIKANLDLTLIDIGEKIHAISVSKIRENNKRFLIDNLIFSKSQFLQDLQVLFLTNSKKSGYFVEFGACDGVELSNTYLLEKSFGWTGIVCEPMHDWSLSLNKNRNCIIDFRAVWSESNQTLYLQKFGPLGLSKFDINPLARQSKSGRFKGVETVSLNDLLIQHSAPNMIDFISIDTEGSEYSILSEFPFEAWDVKIFCVEHNNREEKFKIRQLFENNNYERLDFELDPIDDWFIKNIK